jgi:hypothetical protein
MLQQVQVYRRPAKKPVNRIYLSLDFQNYKRPSNFGRVIPTHGKIFFSAPTISNPCTGKTMVREDEWRPESVEFTAGKSAPLGIDESDEFKLFLERNYGSEIRQKLIQEAAKRK